MGITSFVVSLLGGSASAIAVVLALSKWLGPLWAARMLQTEKAKFAEELEALKAKYCQELEAYKDALGRSKSMLQAEIDRSVFVSRAHFETEFEAHKQAFKALAEVRLTMAAIRPMFSVEPQNEPEEDRKKRLAGRLQELIDAYDVAITVIESQSPFYPEKVYQALKECLEAASREVINVKTAGSETFSLNWYEQGAKRMDEFMVAYSKVSDLIRSRISTLQVLPRN